MSHVIKTLCTPIATPTFDELCTLFSYSPMNRPLTSAEIGALYQKSKKSIEVDRCKGRGPKYFKIPGSSLVRYLESEALRFMWRGIESRERETSSVGGQS